MKQWYLFSISIGCLFIVYSNLMDSPTLLLLSGVVLVGLGIFGFMKKK